jgi:hypothetical protein
VEDRIEFANPFTLSDLIVLPQSRVSSPSEGKTLLQPSTLLQRQLKEQQLTFLAPSFSIVAWDIGWWIKDRYCLLVMGKKLLTTIPGREWSSLDATRQTILADDVVIPCMHACFCHQQKFLSCWRNDE